MNYIVSGLERSGTSLMMQILDKAGFLVAYDDSRKQDKFNPNGYYELFGGHIINALTYSLVHFDKYIDKAIKITSYGMKLLPKDREYKIIYMERDIDEVIKSSRIMGAKNDYKDDLIKLNNRTKLYLGCRRNIDYIVINYNDLVKNPKLELDNITNFLNYDVSKGIEAIDKKLWRNRNE